MHNGCIPSFSSVVIMIFFDGHASLYLVERIDVMHPAFVSRNEPIKLGDRLEFDRKRGPDQICARSKPLGFILNIQGLLAHESKTASMFFLLRLSETARIQYSR